MRSYLLFPISLAFVAAWFGQVQAATLPYQPTIDCVIQKFVGDYTANLDSSLDVRETINYDCGTVFGKHGIFRVLPTVEPKSLKGGGSYVDTPITLKSITDERGNPYQYTTQTTADTLTWKIGSPSVTITGLHTYVLSYTVKNALAYNQNGKDGFIWNIAGQFWALPINNFEATVHFPAGVTQQNSEVSIFSGPQDTASNHLAATSTWVDSQTLQVSTDQVLPPNNGVTLAALFPRGIITPATRPLWDILRPILDFIPGLLLVLGYFLYWRRNGRDPRVSRVIAPEFEPPAGLRPAEAKAIDEEWNAKSDYFSATLIDLAVRGYLTIQNQPKQGFFGQDNAIFTRTDKPISSDLKEFEQAALTLIFEQGQTTTLSALKASLSNKLINPLQIFNVQVASSIEEANLMDANSLKARSTAIGGIGLLVLLGFFALQAHVGLSLVGVGIICALPFMALFAYLMPRRTPEGAVIEGKIKGFQLYMKKAEQYRQRFNEEQGIFDRLLPYAIAFGLTSYWVKAMKMAYGNNYAYSPIWWVGNPIGMGNNFSALDSLQGQINSISNSVSSSIADANARSSSGGGFGGGGGFSGGGGGGGGGGSW
jgi:uncharacterized membrane protein